MRWTNYILLLGIGVIWGSQFFFVKLVIDDIQPLTLAAYKALIGAASLGVLSLFIKDHSAKDRPNSTKPDPSKKRWPIYVAIALLEAVIPFFLIGWGQQTIDSSLTAILMGTVPIFTILLAAAFVPNETISALKWGSVLCGFIGVLVLIAPDLSFAAVHLDILRILAILGAALSFAGSLILLKQLPALSPVLAMRNVLALAAVILIPLAFLFEDPLALQLRAQQTLSLIVLGVFHAGIVYLLYSLLIHRTGAVFASLNNYLVPLIGVILGTLFLNEHLTLTDYLSLLIVLMSLGLGGINVRRAK